MMEYLGLMFVVIALSGVTLALLGIRKSVDNLTSEIRRCGNAAARHTEDECGKDNPRMDHDA